MKVEEVQKLKAHLSHYRELTLNLIKAIEEDNLDDLDKFLEAREKIIENINSMNYDKEIFKELCTNFKLVPLQEKLTFLMNERKNSLRKDMDKLSESKNANKSYKKRFSVDAIYFNKKI